MKDYRNFILIDNDINIITATYANCSSPVSYKKFNKEHPKTKISNNNIDALKILNKHMAQILKWKTNNESLSVYYILVPPKFCKIIKDKTYKNWLNPQDKKYNIPNEELKQWKVFETLYKIIFADICIKPNNIYSSKDVNKTYKHIIYTKEIVNKMYVYLDKEKESTAIKTINDLLK